jgi:hypothetical protein
MNQIDLILENIRLGHINQLMLEATTPDEVNRGVALINESMQTVYGVLQEAYYDNNSIYYEATGQVNDTNSNIGRNGRPEARSNITPSIGLIGGVGALVGAGLGEALIFPKIDSMFGDDAGLGGVAGAGVAGGGLALYGMGQTNHQFSDASKTRANNIKVGSNPNGTR